MFTSSKPTQLHFFRDVSPESKWPAGDQDVPNGQRDYGQDRKENADTRHVETPVEYGRQHSRTEVVTLPKIWLRSMRIETISKLPLRPPLPRG